MTDAQIRPMTPDDYPSVYRLWEESEGVGLSPSDERLNVTAFLARNPELSYVATDPEGVIIGAVLCGHDGVRGYLRHLAVARRCRRAGIGRALVERSLTALRRHGIQKCSVFLFADNAGGGRFWEAIGWRVRADLQVVQIMLTGS